MRRWPQIVSNAMEKLSCTSIASTFPCAEICQKFSGPCEAPDLPHLDPYGNQFGSWKSIRWTRSGRRDGQKGSIQNIRHTRSEANEPERAELRRGFVGLKEGEMMTFLQA